jgi:glycerate kinase
VRVHDALGEPVDGHAYARAGRNVAIVEMAAASGLALLGDRRDPRARFDVRNGRTDSRCAGPRRDGASCSRSAARRRPTAGRVRWRRSAMRFLDAAGAMLEPVPAALAALATIDVAAPRPAARHDADRDRLRRR